MNLIEFQRHFPDEDACKRHLKALRERQGVVCVKCGCTDHYWKGYRSQWQCKRCGHRTSLTSGTVMHGTKLPLLYWFIAIHLLTSTKKTFSASELQRQLGHKRYQPIWELLHKLRNVMGRRDSEYTLEGSIELDEGFFTVDSDETAYSLRSISQGKFLSSREATEKLAGIVPTSSTLGFETGTDGDFAPAFLTTYNADKTENAEYLFGNHAPNETDYQTPCRFKPGEKVICLIHEGCDVAFPAIVVGPLTREYLEEFHRTSNDPLVTAQSREEFIDSWLDWNWDSVIVRPLVRLRNDREEMRETVIVNRIYVFQYQKFNL